MEGEAAGKHTLMDAGNTAKSFIETFVYRGGDQIAAWTYAGLRALGLSLAGIALAPVPVASLWLGLGVWLGHRQIVLAGECEKREKTPCF